MISSNENNDLFDNMNNDLLSIFPSPITPLFENYSGGLTLDEDFDNNNYNPKNFHDQNLDNNIINLIEEKPTAYKTNFSLFFPKYNFPEKNLEKKEKVTLFYFKDIQKIFFENDYFNEEIKKKLKYDKNIFEEEKYLLLLKKKKERENDYNNENDNYYNHINNSIEKNKRGRKSNDSVREKHTRTASDNVIKKIKAKLFKICIDFLNNIINLENKENNKLLYIDYKYIDRLNREIDLNILKTPLKNIFSKEITRKVKIKSKDFNKILIEDIINGEIKVEDYDTIKFVFDLTFGEWLDLFTFKKNFDIFKNEHEYNNGNVNFDKIKENLLGLNIVLDEEAKKNKGNYFSLFVFYLYNYERFFWIKRPRKIK